MKNKILFLVLGVLIGVMVTAEYENADKSLICFDYNESLLYKEGKEKELDEYFNIKLFESNPFESVKEFGPFKMGSKSPYAEGNGATYDGKLIPKSNFYIYAIRRGMDMCEFEDCSLSEGRVVRCMGGWLSSLGYHSSANLGDVDGKALKQGMASLVVLADKNSNVIGIYPNHAESDILEILGRQPRYEKTFSECIEKELTNQLNTEESTVKASGVHMNFSLWAFLFDFVVSDLIEGYVKGQKSLWTFSGW